MFSWITGPRISNAIEDLQPEPNYESTFIEHPETPAHQFAVKAFKHAIFGTPAPDSENEGSKKAEIKAKLEVVNAKSIELSAPKQDPAPLSPSKQPGGILMTPGTANKGRKTVSFGSHVVDNEGKKGNMGKSGIPNDCPGKFPSPWTPGTQLKLDPSSDQRPRTKLTEALLDARTTTQPKSGQKPKARDDSDITIDLGAPRSESGKYWKEQYESYAERSEKELKKVIAKQQLAKKYAMKKDGEVTELITKLEQERKHFRQRERELDQQAKDYEEQFRQNKAQSESASIEIAALKARIATLERSIALPSSELQQSKASFQIYEDSSKEPSQLRPEQDRHVEVSFAPSLSMTSSGKENNSPKPQLRRRQTLPDTVDRPSVPTRIGPGEGEVSVILGKSPRKASQFPETAFASAPPAHSSEQTAKSPLKIRRTDRSSENSAPKSPVAVLPSSPLPMPSPDPWLDMNQSSIPQMDKMAMPGFSGEPYSRPAWNPPPRQHRPSKSVSNAKHTEASFLEKSKKEKLAATAGKTKPVNSRSQVKESLDVERKTVIRSANDTNLQNSRAGLHISTHTVVADSKFDIPKVAAHHADGVSQAKRDTLDVGIDRKEQARRRLEERKRLRKNGPA